MDGDELEMLIEGIENYLAPLRSELRYNSYVVAQCNSKKRLKPENLYKFCWEKEAPQEPVLNKDEIIKHAEALKKFIDAVDPEAGNVI
jgi:hypothetical protein